MPRSPSSPARGSICTISRVISTNVPARSTCIPARRRIRLPLMSETKTPPARGSQKPDSEIRKSWQGYLRPDGRKGVRNLVLIIYTVECAQHVAHAIAAGEEDAQV